MKFQIPKASTSVILTVFIQDSSSSTGAGLGSLDQTSSITGGYVKRNGTGVALTVDENVTTEGTYEAPSTAAQVRIGTPANMPAGFYELHFHNDLFTTADWVTIGLSGASNMAPLTLEVQLTSMDLNDAVRGGMTALPDAVADAAGGLPISDTGALDLDSKLANTNEVTAARMAELDGANLPADNAAIKADTAAILLDTAEIGAAGADLTDLGGMSTGMKAEVNAEVDDVISTDTGTEVSSVPSATAPLRAQVQLQHQVLRNKLDITNTTKKVHNDAGTLVGTKALTDDGTTYSEAKMS